MGLIRLSAGLFGDDQGVHHDGTLYEALALNLHDLGILCEQDNREPWFLAEAHDAACLTETIEKFEIALDTTLKQLDRS